MEATVFKLGKWSLDMSCPNAFGKSHIAFVDKNRFGHGKAQKLKLVHDTGFGTL